MSNVGQAASAIVGGVLGFLVGGPTGALYGIQLGLLAGSAVFPTQLPPVIGPRLEDLQTTTSQVGTPVIETWGTIAVPGTVMWLGPVVEVASSEEVGGKGGGSEQTVTTFTYYQSVAVGLCGSANRPIDGISRIWENGKLVYDTREQQPGETVEEWEERHIASLLYQGTGSPDKNLEASGKGFSLGRGRGFTLYTGTADQLPDPTIEAVEGVGNVPAFRDLAYVVFHERQLQDDQARRHPQWRFEVWYGEDEQRILTPTPLPDIVISGYQINVILADWAHGRMVFFDQTGGADEEGFRVFSIGTNTEVRQRLFTEALAESARPYPNIGMGTPCIGRYGHIYLPWFTSLDNVAIARINPDTLVMDRYRPEGGASEYWQQAVTILTSYADFILAVSSLGLHFSAYDGNTLDGGPFWSPGAGYTLGAVCAEPTVRGYALALDPDTTASQPILLRRINARGNPTATSFIWNHESLGSIAVSEIDPAWTRVASIRIFLCDLADRNLLIGVEGGPPGDLTQRLFKWSPETGIVWNIEVELPISTNHLNGSLVQNSRMAWPVGSGGTLYLNTSDGSFVIIDWPEAENIFIGEQVFDGGSNRMITFMFGVGPVVLEFGNPVPGDASLAQIVSDVCGDCGLSDTDIDVSDLTSRFVHGYARTRPMSGRSCIEPLRMIGFFDCVESGTVLKWPTRGKPAVATLDTVDLGAQEGDADGPPAVTTKKLQSLELPRMMRVHYLAPSREYEPGEQISPVRLTTDAVNDVDVDLVAALDDDQAAQIAEVIWADAWRARWIHEISIDRYWSELEPADAVVVPVDGRNERMRIASLTTSDLILRRAELLRDDDGSYESTAVAEPPLRQPNRLTAYASTELLLLDLPPLREQDDDAGIYAATARSGIGTRWAGAVIYRNTVGSDAWTQVASVANEAIVGRINTALAPGITSTWDYENAIDVVIASGVALESRPEADVLAGANAAAIGVHGRWEIVQFLNAEEISANRWRLTTLLRGRRGTEHLVGTCQINDRFVLISGPGIVRIPLATSQIGVESSYRAVTIGSTLSAAQGQSFTSTGMALETFSPVHVLGDRDSSEDLTITWIRRDRLYQTMRDAVELPNSEANESYSIDVLDGSSVVRTLTSSAPSVVYTAADQTTDFGAPQSEVTVRIYQLSAFVGRGTPAEATI